MKTLNPGRAPIQKTMFYTEGNPAALLVINRAGQRREETKQFPTAEAALGWCRENLCSLFYMPVDIAHG